MRLYLAQHGDAVPEEQDPQRPLSERGCVDVRRVAEFLAGVGVRVSTILHSGKIRAEQTATLLASSIAPAQPPEKTSGIAPLDSASHFARTANAWTEDTMVVGHQPFMGRLVSHLLTGSETGMIVAFRPGSVVCLEKERGENWQIAWMLRPELLTKS